MKKYGIYIGQLVEKLKNMQGFSQELFESIAQQSAALIDKQIDPTQKQQILHDSDDKKNEDISGKLKDGQ